MPKTYFDKITDLMSKLEALSTENSKLKAKNEALTEQLRIGGVSQLLSEYENFKLIKQDLLQNRNEFINEFLKERNCG